MRLMLLTLLFLPLATAALATDGVLEINQTCAVQTGCIDNSGGIGDTAGFPVSIEIPGSYVLTSDLVVSDPNKDGIFIATAPVSIDLNGFEIRGPVSCTGSGSTLSCDAGTGRGIRSNFVRQTISNGSVIRFGSDGIQLGGRSRVHGVVAERNGGDGIRTGANSLVTDSRAYRNEGNGLNIGASSVAKLCTSASNGLNGILAASGSIVSESASSQNGDDGISAEDGSTVSGNTANENEGTGISGGNGMLVSGNTVYLNGDNGISSPLGSTVSGNATFLNAGNGISVFSGSVVSDNASYENTLDGISADAGCTIQGNSLRGNDAWGLDIATPTSAYRENTITVSETNLGTVDGGVDAGGNVCNGSLTCP
jgi:hypothetical protein